MADPDIPNDSPSDSPDGHRAARRRAYWRANLRWVLALLLLWFAVSYGCGILFVDELNQFRVGGFKLGFWFAQQGSIYAFVLLIGIYVLAMNHLDRKFGAKRE